MGKALSAYDKEAYGKPPAFRLLSDDGDTARGTDGVSFAAIFVDSKGLCAFRIFFCMPLSLRYGCLIEMLRPRFDYIGDRKFCLARAGKAVSLCGLRSEAKALLIPFCDSFRAQKQNRTN